MSQPSAPLTAHAFCWTVTSMRIGATACICSPSSTMVSNHTVEITILSTEDETPTEFYLMALITA